MNLLIFNGILYSVFYAVTTTISTLFQTAYPFLNETDTGLCFLAIGGGTIIGGLITGKLLDRDYRKVKERILLEASTDTENQVSAEQVASDENFPIEQARMRKIPFHLIVYSVCCAGYGWCLEKNVNMAAPLVLQIVCEFFFWSLQACANTRSEQSLNRTFLVAISGIALMNTVQTLLIDLLPAQGSSVTACVSFHLAYN